MSEARHPLGYYMNPFRAEPHVVKTTLSPAACSERLSPLVGSLLSREPRPLVGTVSPARVLVAKRIAYNNAFRPHARGSFQTDEQGTSLLLRVGPHPIAVWVMTCLWLSLTLGYLGLMLQLGLHGPGLAMVLLFPALGLGTYALGRYLGRHEDAWLMDELTRTLGDGTL